MSPNSHHLEFSFDDSTAYRLVRASELRKEPWKNGGGSTKELMRLPANASLDNFDWRISIAEVKTEGPFSIFPNIERNITLLKGESMVLNNNITGQAHTLNPLCPYDFSGEDDISATLPHGETEDFNVMVRQDSGLHAQVQLLQGTHQLHIGNKPQLLYCAVGSCRLSNALGNSLLLNTGDSIYFPVNPSATNNAFPSLHVNGGQCLHVILSPTT